MVHHSEEVLANMNDWCKEHHGKSGLAQRVRESVLTMEEAEEQVLEFVSRYVNLNGAQLAVRWCLGLVSCNAGVVACGDSFPGANTSVAGLSQALRV